MRFLGTVREQFLNFVRYLTNSVDASTLALVRIGFGGLMIWEVSRYFSKGWIHDYFVKPEFHFKYPWFEWVQPWPGEWMFVHFWILGITAFCISVGLFYRLASLLFFVGFTHVFLIEKAIYLNHFYLICLLGFLFVLVPAHRSFSIDSLWMGFDSPGTVPRWSYWIMRFQVGVVYFFGAVAKMNADWLRGQPAGVWLSKNNVDLPYLSDWFVDAELGLAVSYGGLLVDLFAVPLLLWRRTRYLMASVLVIFHLVNAKYFYIGVFPWMAIALIPLFFDPSWARRMISYLKLDFSAGSRESFERSETTSIQASEVVLISLLLVYVFVQLLLPVRAFFYSMVPTWSSYGHRFAWRMKLHHIESDSTFYVAEKGSDNWKRVPPYSVAKLNQLQLNRLSRYPDQVKQFADYIANYYESNKGYEGARVKVRNRGSLNGRPWQTRIKEDLIISDRSFDSPKEWINPIKHDLSKNGNLLRKVLKRWNLDDYF